MGGIRALCVGVAGTWRAVSRMWSRSLVSQVVVHHDSDLLPPRRSAVSRANTTSQRSKEEELDTLGVTGVAYNGRNHSGEKAL